MDVQHFTREINWSQYVDPPVADLVENPALVVSLINITPIVPQRIPIPSGAMIPWGRHNFFREIVTSSVTLVGQLNKSPSSVKFELGKEFGNYFESDIPQGYEKLLPENAGRARELAGSMEQDAESDPIQQHFIDNVIAEKSEFANSVYLVYHFQYTSAVNHRYIQGESDALAAGMCRVIWHN